MADPLETIATLLAPSFTAVAGTPTDPVVRPSDRADAQANGALAAAKALGRPPRQVAEEVVALAAPSLAGVATLEVAGPGFLNVVFDDGFLAVAAGEVARDERFGVALAATPEVVVVDYSAPNVAKEMHVGHLRTTIIGDALVRLLEAQGHTVVRENHIGDWGTPFGMLIEHLLDVGEAEAADELSMGDLDGFYKEARRKFDADDDFKERSRQRVVTLQAGDEATLASWRLLVAESTRYFEEVYRRLGVRLLPSDVVGESFYNDALASVVADLDAAGLLVESDGAEVVFPPGFTNREGQPLPLIIRKADGGYNYATTDLAAVRDRTTRLGATLLLYVVDAGQSQHFQMVFAVAQQAGWLVPPARAEHVGFGIVLGEDRRRLRSRSGDTLKLVDLLQEAVDRAGAAVAERNPELPAQEQAAVAQVVGIGAIKYADLSSDRIKDYVFDWDRMLAFDGNTGPYLQYAHARICSIFRRAEVPRADVRGAIATPGTPQERALLLALLGYPTAVADATERTSPHRLCGYLFELASTFTAFYEACTVLGAEGELRTSRLALCDLTAGVLAHGLDLLGIAAPERM